MKPARLPESGADPSAACKGERRAYFSEIADFVATPVYDRYRLGAGMAFDGPAIVEERESTIVVPPGLTASVDAFGNVRLTQARLEERGGG